MQRSRRKYRSGSCVASQAEPVPDQGNRELPPSVEPVPYAHSHSANRESPTRLMHKPSDRPAEGMGAFRGLQC